MNATQNTLPDKPANTNPEYAQKWRDYWRYEANHKNDDYQKKYQANITRQRQIAKLYELMDKYPDEVRQRLAR